MNNGLLYCCDKSQHSMEVNQMSEQTENTQVVQDLYAAFNRGDMPAILDLLDEQIDWHFVGRPQDVPFAGRRHGHQQMMAFFGTVAATCDVLAFGPNELSSYDDRVVSLGSEQVRVKNTGRIFESDWVHLFTVRNGKIVQLREYYDTAAIAEAFRA
jgi:uncharacterized protein